MTDANHRNPIGKPLIQGASKCSSTELLHVASRSALSLAGINSQYPSTSPIPASWHRLSQRSSPLLENLWSFLCFLQTPLSQWTPVKPAANAGLLLAPPVW